MHKIYFDDRCVTICPEEGQGAPVSDAMVFRNTGRAGLQELAARIENGDIQDNIYIPGGDEAYREFCSGFREVNAAGGLVSNDKGDYLLIHRRGRWDLPKGHQEEGERIQDTAVREVREETGLEILELGDLICMTDHCYFRNGIWHLKHTWWYEMHCSTSSVLKPQVEEEISEVAWMCGSSIAAIISGTFPSIAEVFLKANIIAGKI